MLKVQNTRNSKKIIEINPTKYEEAMSNSQNPPKIKCFTPKKGHTQHLQHTMCRRVLDVTIILI